MDAKLRSVFIPSTRVGIFLELYSDTIEICSEDLPLKVRALHAWLPYKKCRRKRKLFELCVCSVSCVKLQIG